MKSVTADGTGTRRAESARSRGPGRRAGVRGCPRHRRSDPGVRSCPFRPARRRGSGQERDLPSVRRPGETRHSACVDGGPRSLSSRGGPSDLVRAVPVRKEGDRLPVGGPSAIRPCPDRPSTAAALRSARRPAKCGWGSCSSRDRPRQGRRPPCRRPVMQTSWMFQDPEQILDPDRPDVRIDRPRANRHEKGGRGGEDGGFQARSSLEIPWNQLSVFRSLSS